MAHCSSALRGTPPILLIALTCAPFAATAHAQPSVRVRAATQLELEALPSEHGLTLQGILHDDLGQPLPARPIELQLTTDAGAKQQRTRQTGDDGSFRAVFALPPGRYRALARFAGDVAYTEGAQQRELDAGKADVRLRFVEPRTLRVDLDEKTHVIAVRASSSAGASGIDLRVQDEQGHELVHARSDDDGVVRAELASAALGPAGIGKLIAQSSADAERSAASSEIEVMRFERSTLAFRARVDAAHERLVLEGTLRAGARGLGDEAIGVFDGTQHLVTLRTGADGVFAYSGAMPKQASTSARVLRLQARFDNDAPWIGASRSRVIELKLPDTSAPSVLWLFVPLAACAIGLWLLSRREIEARRQNAAPPERGAGVRLAGRVTRGRVEAFRIAGSVRDASGERPIAGAVLALTATTATAGTAPALRGGASSTGERSEIRSGEDGRFASAELTAGSYVLQVEALGYVTLTSPLHVPHRGEWSDVQVLLTNARDAAVAAYRPVAERALPSRDLWDRWTARETLESATRAGRAPQSFTQLTEDVERAAYAKSPPNASDLATIERTADAALAEMPDTTHADQQSHSRNSARLRARIPHHR
jgi:hypothetical protein